MSANDGNNVRVIPVWKKDATAYERLSELASMARANPEQFSKFAFVYYEDISETQWKLRYLTHSCKALEAYGLFAAGMADCQRDTGL